MRALHTLALLGSVESLAQSALAYSPPVLPGQQSGSWGSSWGQQSGGWGSSYPSRLAGRSPSEQLQITKCRSGQTCEKCRQLNCYWDATGRITNRCIALGLESTQIPVDRGQASNLGQCPVFGQQGSMGVNWLAIEASGSQVPNLDSMSDADVYRWISGLPNYRPDDTSVNYPAGMVFRDLLPSAAQEYHSGKIPSTTPWVSFWDGLNSGYLDDSYRYDDSYYYGLPNFPGSNFNSNFNTPSFPQTGFTGFYPSYPGTIDSFNPSVSGFAGGFSGILPPSSCGTCPYTGSGFSSSLSGAYGPIGAGAPGSPNAFAFNGLGPNIFGSSPISITASVSAPAGR